MELGIKEEKKKKIGKKIILLGCIIIIIIMLVFLVINSREAKIKTIVKSTLDKIVEKSDLETSNVTYNIIAKKCKDKTACDMNSTNIDDFEMVLSCKGNLTAGIDFDDVKLEINRKNEKIVVTIPNAIIKGEPNIISVRALNGEDLPANKLPEARNICQEKTKEKSEQDDKLLPAAKEQARIVLEEYYNQWVKAMNLEYKVEVK